MKKAAITAIVIFSILITLNTMTNARNSVNSTTFKLSKDFTKIKTQKRRSLLSVNKYERINDKKNTTVDISGFVALFIIFTSGLYIFLRSEITIRKISPIEFNQIIAMPQSIEIP